MKHNGLSYCKALLQKGQNILHDFNIAKEANGTGKGIIKSINTDVDGTLEIHFYWAGKGTDNIPTKGVYGPLISAISVTPNFKPDTGNKISVGAILGIVAGICAVVVLISIALWVCWRKNQAGYNGPERTRLNLDWQTRRMISLGIARGLTYLHEESTLKIVHRDIKATNILLDKDLNAKISDFGLAKLDEEDNSHISTRVAGTIGYMAPEYAMRGYLTEKADVYSFGVVMLEIVSGISNTGYRPKEDFTYLLDWAYVLEEQGKLLDLVDPNLGTNYSKEEALQMLSLCLMCTNPSPTLRPLMSTVVSILEGKSPVQIPPVKHAALNYGDASFKSFEGCSYDNQMHNVSNDEPGTESSISLQSMKDAVAHSLLSIVHSDYSEASTINLESETGNVDGPNFNSTLESRIP